MIERISQFWSQNIILANFSHMALGFGLAVVLQRYARGQSLVPVFIGWLLLAFGLGAHIYAATR